ASRTPSLFRGRVVFPVRSFQRDVAAAKRVGASIASGRSATCSDGHRSQAKPSAAATGAREALRSSSFLPERRGATSPMGRQGLARKKGLLVPAGECSVFRVAPPY